MIYGAKSEFTVQDDVRRVLGFLEVELKPIRDIERMSPEKPIIILRYTLEGRNHCFSVEDNGIGVFPENRERMFDFTAQGDEKGDGYGIGLALCKKIVGMHCGNIWVDEIYSPGCRICFTIPRHPLLRH